MTDAPTTNDDLLRQFANEYFLEKKRQRRHKLMRRVFLLAILLLVLFSLWSRSLGGLFGSSGKHAALIRINGAIMADQKANSRDIIDALQHAFKDESTSGVILEINSPGGSPVQADDIFSAIRRFKQSRKDIKVYAVCTDICASAAYYIAAASDDIYANPSSLVGSIGVLYNGFGFVGSLEKLGIERRLITAGKNKGFMDPFSPVNQADKAKLEALLKQVHLQFEQRVIEGRGKRISNANKQELFSGLFWTGAQAKQLGLIDGFASSRDVARNIIKTKHLRNYTPNRSILDKAMRRLSSQIGHAVVGQLTTARIE